MSASDEVVTSIAEGLEPGIGAGGVSLKAMMAETERLYRESGCYAGIGHTHLLSDDPIKGELFHSRLLSALIAGRETTKMISGSPLVREVSELAIGLYTPNGDNIAQSTGIQVHSRPMGEAIKWMINNDWESKVGIAPGDLFWFNECSIAGMHPADVYDILPIFWQGELVAWVCTVIMEMDIGAVTPGCMPTANVERATDGVRFAGEKVGSNDQLRHDMALKCELSFDMADIFLLDRKGAIAANIRVRDEMEKMIEEFGLDYFLRAGKELIEEERLNQLKRLRQRTVPGRYRNVLPFEFYMAKQPVAWLPAKKDHIRLAPIEMRIESSGSIVLDFEGAGEWGWHPFNATPSGMMGGLSIAVVQSLSWDGRANYGSLLPFDVRTPLDSVLNPADPRPLAQASIWAPVIDTFSLWLGMLSDSYFLRGFREEMLNFRSASAIAMEGFDITGTRRPMIASPTGTMACGAGACRDGLDPGGMLPTPEVDLGNSEIWEMFVPYLDMGRRFDPYSVGAGKFRSGICIPHAHMIHGSDRTLGAALVSSGAHYILPNLGASGGYPGGRNSFVILQNTNVVELMAEGKPLVHEFGHPDHPEYESKIESDVWIPHHMPEPFELNDGDIIYNLFGAPGGFGDPLEREPERIRQDLDNGLTTADIASRLHGVEAHLPQGEHEWQIDEAASDSRRQSLRQQRLQRAVPVEQWWQSARQRVQAGNMDEKLSEMYASSMKLSKPFSQEFRAFWALPEDFTLEVQ